MRVRRMLTEILLEVTDSEVRVLAREVYSRARIQASKGRHDRPLCHWLDFNVLKFQYFQNNMPCIGIYWKTYFWTVVIFIVAMGIRDYKLLDRFSKSVAIDWTSNNLLEFYNVSFGCTVHICFFCLFLNNKKNLQIIIPFSGKFNWMYVYYDYEKQFNYYYTMLLP